MLPPIATELESGSAVMKCQCVRVELSNSKLEDEMLHRYMLYFSFLGGGNETMSLVIRIIRKEISAADVLLN